MSEKNNSIFGGSFSPSEAAKSFLDRAKSGMPWEIKKRNQLAAKAKREAGQAKVGELQERVRQLEADKAAAAAAAKKRAAAKVVRSAAKKSAAAKKAASKTAARASRATAKAAAKAAAKASKPVSRALKKLTKAPARAAKKATKTAAAAKKSVGKLAKQQKKQSGFKYKPSPLGSGIGLIGPSKTKKSVQGIPDPRALPRPERKPAGKITKPIR